MSRCGHVDRLGLFMAILWCSVKPVILSIWLVDVYLKNLPEDYVPYWDFNAPDIPNAPRDASAACVVASALLEMSGFYGNGQGEKYKEAAEKMLCSLSSDKYQSRDMNVAFLLHSTGHWLIIMMKRSGIRLRILRAS